MNAYTELDPLIRRNIPVVVGHAALDLNSTSGGVHRARELDQHAIACGLDDAPPMLSDFEIDKRSPDSLQLGQRIFFIDAHKAAVTGDINRQNSR